jgi:excisionase family DNA binding protein
MTEMKPAPNYRGDDAPTGELERSPLASDAARNVSTVAELARRWNVNVKTIYGMIDRKELSVMRVGRLVRIARSVIETWESQGRVVPGGH